MVDTVIFLTTTGAGNWTVPSDWSSTNKIECIGGGGGGPLSPSSYGDAGAGGYSKVVNQSLSPGASIAYSVAVGGAGEVGATAPQPGGDTWFGNAVYASATVGAKGGAVSTSSASRLGGQSSAGIGTTKFSGGNGASTAGGAGAAGPNGAGANATASSTTGGAGGNGSGGAGGTANNDGGNGAEWTSTAGPTGGSGGGGGARTSGSVGANGGLYGGGAGNNQAGGTTAPHGGQGIIVITYTPASADTLAAQSCM